MLTQQRSSADLKVPANGKQPAEILADNPSSSIQHLKICEASETRQSHASKKALSDSDTKSKGQWQNAEIGGCVKDPEEYKVFESSVLHLLPVGLLPTTLHALPFLRTERQIAMS